MDAHRSLSRSAILLLCIGIALRLLLAYFMLPSSGRNTDIAVYTYWSLQLADVGPEDFYASTPSADYPPGYLYVLWLVGEVSRSIASAEAFEPASVARSLIKIPPILLDACAALMLYRIARSWSPERKNAERAGLAAAAIYLFNPVTMYDSAIWGQADAAGACIMLAALISIIRGPPELTAVIAVLAALIKPQFGVILAPLVGIVLTRRHLLHRTAPSGNASMERGPVLNRDGPIRLLTSALVGIIIFYALVTPFNLDFRSFLERMTETANGYPYLSVNASNPWALLSSGEAPSLAFSGLNSSEDHWSRDDIPIVGSISGVTIGAALLAVGLLVGAARLLWRMDKWSIAVVGVYLSMCFFMLPTRVHERYLFTAFAFTPLLAVFDRKWRWLTVALTIGLLMNFHGVMTALWVSMPLGEFSQSPAGMLISISLHTAAFLFVIWSLRPANVRSPMVSANAGVGRSPGPT